MRKPSSSARERGRAQQPGLCFLKQRRFAEATREYEQVLRLNPNDAEAHNNLGNMLARQGHVEEALPTSPRLCASRPTIPKRMTISGRPWRPGATTPRRRRSSGSPAPEARLYECDAKAGAGAGSAAAFRASRGPLPADVAVEPGDAQAHAGLGVCCSKPVNRTRPWNSGPRPRGWTRRTRVSLPPGAALARKGICRGQRFSSTRCWNWIRSLRRLTTALGGSAA